MKSLKDFLSSDIQNNELYTTDQKYRFVRAKKGLYSSQTDCFDFIHLVQNWEKIVGPMLAQNTVPLKIKADYLIVITKHAIFSQELGFMTPIILKKITQLFPKFNNQFNKIKFINSEKYFTVVPPKSLEKNNLKSKQGHAFSPDYQRKLMHAQKMFQHIEDEEIRDLLVSLFLQK